MAHYDAYEESNRIMQDIVGKVQKKMDLIFELRILEYLAAGGSLSDLVIGVHPDSTWDLRTRDGNIVLVSIGPIRCGKDDKGDYSMSLPTTFFKEPVE